MRRLALLASLVAALALGVVAAGAGAGTAAPPMKSVRAGDVTLKLPASWKVRRNVGILRLVGVAPSAGSNVTVASTPRTPGESVETWRKQLIRGLSALPDGLVVRSRIVRLQAGRAVEVSATGGAGKTAQALMYGIQAGEKAVVVVFTTRASNWRRQAPLFRTIARTVRVRS